MSKFIRRIAFEADAAKAEVVRAEERIKSADAEIVQQRLIRATYKLDARIHRKAERLLRKVAALLD